MNIVRTILFACSFLLVITTTYAQQPAVDDLLDTVKKPGTKPASTGGIDDLLEGKGGGIRFRLVALRADQPPLDDRLFWRRFQGTIAAETVPAEIRIDDHVVMASQLESEADAEESATPLQATTGTAKLATRDQTLMPFKITLRPQKGTFVANHPAIRNDAKTGEVHVVCVPVRFEFQDSSGRFVGTPFQLQCVGVPLMRKIPRVTRLTIWLPVGLSYESTLGKFSLAADGKLQTIGGLPTGVTRTELGFRKTVDGELTKPRSATPAEVVVINTQPPYSVFISNRLTPGERPRIAVARSAFVAANGVDPKPESFGLWQLNQPTEKAVACSPPDAKLVQRAAASLNANADQLVWCELPWRAELGVNRLIIAAQYGGNVQHNVLVAEPQRELYLVPHRMRTVFANTETPVFHVILPAGHRAGEATIMAIPQDAKSSKPGDPLVLGRIALPAVEKGFDSRSFELRAANLPPGRYHLSVKQGELHSANLPCEVVSWNHDLSRPNQSPFYVHSMIWGNRWPESDEALQAIRDAGVELLIQGQVLDAEMPRLEPAWQSQLDSDSLPAELAWQRTRNDSLLERLTRHQLAHVDFAVTRTAGFYNEGLSYHHSYQPSVDRMIQRLQIFTQQTLEYPSAAGVNFSWFPQMGGYVEGGVPTDAHTADRNRTLGANLARQGILPLSKEDRQWLQKNYASTNPDDARRARQLEEQDYYHWKGAFELGFGQHNDRYVKAIREVKPQTVNTLYENAGHDSGKRPDQMFDNMNATSYFTMTDYGDWPMSAAFTTEWSRAVSLGRIGQDGNPRPVWLTTEFLNSTEGQTKQLFHAFARGLDGGGFPMTADKPIAELQRRGKVLKFLSQYGAIAKYAKPDRRVAILATNAKHRFSGNGSYEYHALLYHLTRLGYPPAIVAEDRVLNTGIPAETKVLALVNVDRPLPIDLVSVIRSFQQRGGRVVVCGPAVPQIDSAIQSKAAITSIWQGPGFKPDTHTWLWKQFNEVKEELTTNLQKAELEPLAACDPAHGYALTLQGNNIRYVVVIADQQDTHVSQFGREEGLRVAIRCAEGERVRDLRTQTDLEVHRQAGKAYVSVDLVTEPTTLLAVFQQVPEKIETLVQKHGDGIALIDFREVNGRLTNPLADTKNFEGWPLSWEWGNPQGSWEVRFGAMGEITGVLTPKLTASGSWKLRCQELITGRTFESLFDIAAATDKSPTAKSLPSVHVSNPNHLRDFLRRRGEMVIVLEPGQASLTSVAELLIEKLQAEGIAARLWKVQPEDIDTQPNRWYLRPEDESRQKLIDGGKLIGYREQMKAYIDKLKAVHIPERGGYTTTGPDFMIGQDTIVFSGGRLAESLRQVSTWMDTPNVPGNGQSRLVVAFSPFAAGKQTLALIGKDEIGLKNAIEAIVTQIHTNRENDKFTPGLTSGPQTAVQPDVKPKVNPTPPSNKSDLATQTFRFTETRPVPRPYQSFSPHRRVRELVSNERGQAAVVLRDGTGVAIVDESGKTTAAVQDVDTLTTFDRQSQLWDVRAERSETGASVELRCIDANGQLKATLPAFTGGPVPPGYEAGYVASPTGQQVAVGQLGTVLIGSPLDAAWNVYRDTPHAQERFAVFYPRMPIAAVYSPDGRYLCLSLDTRPPLNNMSGPLFQPTFAETILLDTQSGRRVWSLRDRTPQRSTYAVHRGFMAVSRNAQRVALADYDGGIYLVDAAGKEIVARRPDKIDRTASSRLSPTDGVGVSLADDGSLAVFGYRQSLVLGTPERLIDVPLTDVVSVGVTRSGSHVVAATEEGAIVAIEPSGSIRWTKKLNAVGLHVAPATGDQTFVGTGDGELLLVDAQGEIVRRTDVFTTAKQVARPATRTKATQELPAPKIYVAPDTLEIAQRRLQAKQVATWQPSGPITESFGQKFHRTDVAIQLNAPTVDNAFLHLVYRRPTSQKPLKITTSGADGRETFELDLPTPTFRAIDLPIRGPRIQVSIDPAETVEIAECSLWSYTLPGPNLALVKVSAPGEKKPKSTGATDDLLADLTGGPTGPSDLSGKAKNCKIWWPNTDPDRTKGHFLPAPVDPLAMVDGSRFGSGKLQPWAAGRSASWGGSFTIDFGQPVAASLVATYDRVNKQSQVNSALMVFSGGIKGEFDNPPPLSAANENDQFWRLFDFETTKVQILGVHVFAGNVPCGLSEIEAFR